MILIDFFSRITTRSKRLAKRSDMARICSVRKRNGRAAAGTFQPQSQVTTPLHSGRTRKYYHGRIQEAQGNKRFKNYFTTLIRIRFFFFVLKYIFLIGR